ncbi:MAG: hypothetical protein KDI82_00320 [Gammaproteobacteria bacterium]|nr:hypothetical protein [Gammaproteobacteria bacterium]
MNEVDAWLSKTGCVPNRSWTIDHDREIYLRQIKKGRGESSYKTTWHFRRNGELMSLCLALRSAGGERGSDGWSHYELIECYGEGFFVPNHLLDQRDDIIADLREALEAYGGGGIHSSRASSKMTLTL